MLNKDELEREVAKIIAASDTDAQRLDIEAFIGEVKAMLLKETGEAFASHALMLAVVASDKGEKEKDAVIARAARMRHTSFYIAQAAEMIMRRMWLD